MNSALHSYLMVGYTRADGVSLDVGFYYMTNDIGSLTGTLLSGWIYHTYGLQPCLWAASLMLLLATVLSLGLPRQNPVRSSVDNNFPLDCLEYR